jgi:hypothetical protein
MSKVFITLLLLPLVFVLCEYQIAMSKPPTSPKKFERFFSEHSILGKGVRSVGAHIKQWVGAPKIGNVCFGENGFLFYCTQTDGTPMENIAAQSKKPLKAYEMDHKEKLMPFANKLYVILAPNKERIFWNEFFASRYVAPHESGAYFVTESSLALVAGHYLGVADLTRIFNKNQEAYYKQNTHWTSKGAYEALKALNLPEVESNLNFQVKHHGGPDLIFLLNRAGVDLAHIDKTFKPSKYEVTHQKGEREEEIFTNPARSGKVLVIGDSFREAFTPVVAQFFGQITDVHVNKFRPELYDLTGYNYIFLIRVERYVQ